MPSKKTPVLHGLLKVVVVVVVAALVGLGLGIGLNQVLGKTKPSGSGTKAAFEQTEPGGATGPAKAAAASLDLGRGLALQVDSAAFVAAKTTAPRKLKRSRIIVQATVTNGGTSTVTPPVLRLAIAAGGADLRATGVTGPLLRPLAPGAVAKGKLNFEAGRAATAALRGVNAVPISYGSQTLMVAVG